MNWYMLAHRTPRAYSDESDCGKHYAYCSSIRNIGAFDAHCYAAHIANLAFRAGNICPKAQREDM
jgi:hypothetical protein